jgi:glycosyltransferase involved in cell wall biosynthesis
MEAMAAGRPIVATDVGANRRLLAGGEFGTLVPPGDAQALAEAIRSQLAQWDRAVRVGEAARRHVRAHYSRAAMLLRFEQFYKRLCA